MKVITSRWRSTFMAAAMVALASSATAGAFATALADGLAPSDQPPGLRVGDSSGTLPASAALSL